MHRDYLEHPHRPDNKDCRAHLMPVADWEKYCTCKPRSDEIEAIRDEFNTTVYTYSEFEAMILELRQQNETLREAIEAAYEEYAGSEWGEPETAPEAYYQKVIKDMANILGKAKALKDTE